MERIENKKFFDSWKFLKTFIRRLHNRRVDEFFGTLSDYDVKKARKQNVKLACKILANDTALIILIRLFFFEIILGNYNQKFPAIASIPEWYQIRIGADRPQLVVQFAEKFKNGKLGRTRWSLSIPHYKGDKNPEIPTYRKGQKEGILTLKDNSKIIVNCASDEECERVLKALMKQIKPVMLKDHHIKIGERKGKKLKVCSVVPTNAQYFKTGQKNMLPDWVKPL